MEETTTKPEYTTTLRIPAAVAEQLKDLYANTYPQHRLSFNAWLVARVTRS